MQRPNYAWWCCCWWDANKIWPYSTPLKIQDDVCLYIIGFMLNHLPRISSLVVCVDYHPFRMMLRFFQIKSRNCCATLCTPVSWLSFIPKQFLYLTEPYAHTIIVLLLCLLLHYTICVIARCVSGGCLLLRI